MSKHNEPSKCKRCDELFHCSASGKCWCYEVYIPPVLLVEIEEKYDNCLCSECISVLLQETKNEQT